MATSARFLAWAFPLWHTSQASTAAGYVPPTPTLKIVLRDNSLLAWPITLTRNEAVAVELDLAERLAAAGRTAMGVGVAVFGSIQIEGPALVESTIIAQLSGGRRHRYEGFRLTVELDNGESWPILCPVAQSE